MKAVKITNPRWLIQHGNVFSKYCDKIAVDGMTYESLMGFFYNAVQFGGDAMELWMAIDDDGPHAFALFRVLVFPYVGTVSCDHFHRWGESGESVDLLIDKFIEFGKRHRATVFTGAFVNEKVYRVFQSRCKGKMEITQTPFVNFTARRITENG